MPNEVLKNTVREEFFPYQITVLIFVTEVSVIPGVTLGKAPLFCEALSVLGKKIIACKIKRETGDDYLTCVYTIKF